MTNCELLNSLGMDLNQISTKTEELNTNVDTDKVADTSKEGSATNEQVENQVNEADSSDKEDVSEENVNTDKVADTPKEGSVANEQVENQVNEADSSDKEDVSEENVNTEKVADIPKEGSAMNEQVEGTMSLFAMLGMEEPKKKEVEKKKETKQKKASATTVTPKVKVNAIEKDKVKIIKAYGDEVMRIEKGENGDLEEIRQYLVDTLGFREFQKDDTEMIIINDGEDTQYIIPQPKFKSKG